MRRVVRSRSYVAQLKALLDEGAERFGAAVARLTLARIDRTIDQHLAHFPATKQPDPVLGLVVYGVRRTPFVLVYDYDDTELRIHFILYATADRTDLDPASAEW